MKTQGAYMKRDFGMYGKLESECAIVLHGNVENGELNTEVDISNKDNHLQYKKEGATHMQYVVLQVVLKEKFIGTGSGNLSELENVINTQASKGYRLHTISTSSSGSKGMLGGDRIQATLVFEKI